MPRNAEICRRKKCDRFERYGTPPENTTNYLCLEADSQRFDTKAEFEAQEVPDDCPHKCGSIDAEKNPSAYNKDFDADNPDHFADWLKMCPSHMTEEEWQFALGELQLMLESVNVKTEKGKSVLMLGWKSKYGLLVMEIG